MHLTVDLTWISLVVLAIGVVLILLDRHLRKKVAWLRRTRELWKSLALALEVELECCIDFNVEVYGEGCLTRLRRRRKLAEQGANASESAEHIRCDLVDMNEVDSESYDCWGDKDNPWWEAD